MNKKLYSIAALIYMNLLPYLCRLPRGIGWAKQYLPSEDKFIEGLLFFHSFYSIPALILILSIYTSKKYAVPFIATFLTLTIATIYFNHGYDLASDAQAAIGLVFYPVVTSFYGFIAFACGYAIQCLIKK